MNRRTAREHAFLTLFSSSFENGFNLDELIEAGRADEGEFAVDAYGEMLLRRYAEHHAAVDEEIRNRLKGWKADRLPRVSLSLLRLAITEMVYGEQGMDSVVINEAVELSKKYGDEGDYQFINGLLGSVARDRAAGGQAPENAATTGEEE